MHSGIYYSVAFKEFESSINLHENLSVEVWVFTILEDPKLKGNKLSWISLPPFDLFFSNEILEA